MQPSPDTSCRLAFTGAVPHGAVCPSVDRAPDGSVAIAPAEANYEPTFRANKYFGAFSILGVRVVYSFDKCLDSVTIAQHFDVRKEHNGAPNGWCARVDTQSQDYFIYRDETGTVIPARLVRDDRDSHYIVADFDPQQKDAALSFSTETRQNTAALLNLHMPRKRVLFLSRVYGNAISKCEIEVHVPNAWKLVNSIPALTFRKGAYRHYTSASHLEPVSVALTFKKRLFPRLSTVFAKDAHPVIWVVLSTALGLIVAGAGMVLKPLILGGKANP